MIPAFEQFLRGAQGRAPFASLGLAVSGGGDSMALLHLAHDWHKDWHKGRRAQSPGGSITLAAVTVDHGLRPEAAEEAAMVARTCATLGIPHETLRWDWDGRGNLHDAARRARYRLMGDWARRHGIEAVALGHTLDDQAETFLMRLARGSGVDGLATMRRDWHDGVRWLRPLLEVPRPDLRAYLRARGLDWAEDPSNDDPRYDRVKARRALQLLAPLGLDAPRLAETAAHMSRAREGLARHAHDAAQRLCHVRAGSVAFDLAGLGAEPPETQHRLFAHALIWISGAEYRPRLDALQEALEAATHGARRSLHGCLIEGGPDQIRIYREYNAVRHEVAEPGQVWDGHWTLTGPDPQARIRALGEAVADCPDWRATGLPRRALMASPAAWRNGALLSAPLAGLDNGWTLRPTRPDTSFFASILSH